MLKERLEKDIINGVRKAEIIGRSIARIPLYKELDTIKIDTNNKTVSEIVDEILMLAENIQ